MYIHPLLIAMCVHTCIGIYTYEYIYQVLALYELLKRRMGAGLATYSIFFDVTKAFDMILHELLLRKCDVIGVRGKFHQFVAALYEDSMVAVHNEDGSVSPPFKLMKGLRQGCPLSPLLFLIIINDLFDNCRSLGATIPISTGGLEFYTTNGILFRIPGFLFADDCVIIADNAGNLYSMKVAVGLWAQKHELQFKAEKCAAIMFTIRLGLGCQDVSAFNDKTLWSLGADPENYSVGDIPLPTPEGYTYLGIYLTYCLSLRAIVDARLAMGQQRLATMMPAIKNSEIPVPDRIQLLKASVFSTTLFGIGIWGLDPANIELVNTFQHKCYRLLLGLMGPIGAMAIGILYKELRCGSVRYTAMKESWRAFKKYPRLNTHIATLLQIPFNHIAGSWVTTTPWALGRVAEEQTTAPGVTDLGSLLVCTDGQASTVIRKWVEAKTDAALRKNAPGYSRYLLEGYTSLFRLPKGTPPCFGPTLNRGIQLLSIFRGGAYSTMFRLHQLRVAGVESRICPFCRNPHRQVDETANHLLFECDRWVALRSKYIGDVLKDVMENWVDNGVDVRQNDARILLLGGTVPNLGRLPGYYPQDGAAEDFPTPTRRAYASYNAVDSEEGVPALWKSRICYRMAGFLTEVDKEQQRIRRIIEESNEGRPHKLLRQA